MKKPRPPSRREREWMREQGNNARRWYQRKRPKAVVAWKHETVAGNGKQS